MTEMLKQVFSTPDGKTFDTKAEALDYLRRPKVLEALNKLTENPELSNWLIENQESVESAFETGTIKRVTKADSKKLTAALEYIKAALGTDPKAAFVVDNADAIQASFRWPSVKRMSPEEKDAEIKATLTALTGDNAELADWIVENQAELLEAYKAGIVKREMSQSAKDALAEYRAKMAAEKAAAAEKA